MKKVLIFLCVFGGYLCQAQSFIGSMGGYAEGTNHNLASSLGELAISTNTNGNFALTQGFHQPNLGFVSLPELYCCFELQLYPNPFVNALNISGNGLAEIDKLLLRDVSGKIVWQSSWMGQAEINLPHLPAGSYFLSAFSHQALLKTFPIIKHH